jgi:AraC-like DNA-binding protein
VVHRSRTTEGLAGLYREICAVVARHYRRPLTVAVVARALASSPRQLQRAFTEVGETSFSAYLREVRLRNAALLLARQPLTVRQVALVVGYRQPAHFAKAFRRRYGLTPARYRERARNRPAGHRDRSAGARCRRHQGPRRVSGQARGERPRAALWHHLSVRRLARGLSPPSGRVALRRRDGRPVLGDRDGQGQRRASARASRGRVVLRMSDAEPHARSRRRRRLLVAALARAIAAALGVITVARERPTDATGGDVARQSRAHVTTSDERDPLQRPPVVTTRPLVATCDASEQRIGEFADGQTSGSRSTAVRS